jgi:hypothetical protein
MRTLDVIKVGASKVAAQFSNEERVLQYKTRDNLVRFTISVKYLQELRDVKLRPKTSRMRVSIPMSQHAYKIAFVITIGKRGAAPYCAHKHSPQQNDLLALRSCFKELLPSLARATVQIAPKALPQITDEMLKLFCRQSLRSYDLLRQNTAI